MESIEKHWSDGLTEFEAWLESMDANERIDAELSDVLIEEFNEEQHRMFIINECV